MKRLLFDRTKLTAYSGIAAALFASKKTDAQIVYTDISPNTIMDNTQINTSLSELIDLNNDGTADLEITSDFYSNSYSAHLRVMRAHAIGEDHIANSVGYWYFCFCSVQANNYGDTIGSNQPSVFWRKVGYLGIPWAFNYWEDGQEHYLGVRLKFKGAIHYGWLRMRIGGSHSVEIMDYAYNSIPNQPIIAGQSLPCSDPFESNNDFATAKSVQTGHVYHGLIDVASDKDFFRWNYTADSLNPNVQISLLDLPENYNLKIYNSQGTQIVISNNPGLEDERIFFNDTLASGNYLIKVYPKNSMHFDPVNCYSLQIESRSTPYSRIATPEMPASEATSIKVFPNPAEDHITFLRTSGLIGELKIMDVTGHEVMTSGPWTEQASVTMDISNLQAGTYFARITGADDVIVTKFIVQK